MAERPVFIPRTEGSLLVETCMVKFQWHAGMAASQKRKSVASLHQAAKEQLGIDRVLEISTKSQEPLGEALSAFNLMYTASASGRQYPLEAIFQSSKVFERGGPYSDIRSLSAREAKQDPRLKESGALVAFTSGGVEWPLQPPTAFYDWLYLNILSSQPELAERLSYYEGFTDIEFNPKKSINCQAYSAALYVGLQTRGLLQDALLSKDNFIACVCSFEQGRTVNETSATGNLF